MRFRRGQIHWYDFVLFGLAAVIVYPDKVLAWLSQWTGKIYGWFHLLILEAIASSAGLGIMLLLMPAYPQLPWWQPLLLVGCLALFRIIMWLALEIFGLND